MTDEVISLKIQLTAIWIFGTYCGWLAIVDMFSAWTYKCTILEGGAAGEDWTPDLTLTKGALYHWATAALLYVAI